MAGSARKTAHKARQHRRSSSSSLLRHTKPEPQRNCHAVMENSRDDRPSVVPVSNDRTLGHPSLKPPDIGCDFGHVVIELMVTTREPAYDSLRNSARVEANMLKRHRSVLAAMIEIDRRLGRQSLAKIGHGLDLLARPATFAHEGRREKKDAMQKEIGRLFGDSTDQDCAADRVTHWNGSIIELGEFFLESCLPACVLGVGLVWHARVADFVVRPEFSLEAVGELVVPFVVRAFLPTALNEQHLMSHCGPRVRRRQSKPAPARRFEPVYGSARSQTFDNRAGAAPGCWMTQKGPRVVARQQLSLQLSL